MTYQFFGHKLYPHIKKITFKFLFLRFPKSPELEVPAFPKESVKGFEHYLTYVTEYLSNFNEEMGRSNFAKSNGGHHLCGKDGFKEFYNKQTKQKEPTDEPNWKCDFKDPFEYWAIVDVNNNNIRTAFKKSELNLTEEDKNNGYLLKKKKYAGCRAWHTSKNSVKKHLNF